MRLPRCAAPGPASPARSGTARLDRRTKSLTSRLRPGDIAVIDHVDLDRVAADALVAVGVAAVLNAKPSRSPAAIPTSAPRCWSRPASRCSTTSGEERVRAVCRRATRSRIDGDTRATSATSRSRAGHRAGRRDGRQAAMADAREGLSVQLEAFAANTMDYLKQERDLLLDGVGVPDIQTQIARPALPDRGARLRLQGRPGRAAARTSGSSSRC